jgi:hypothetical protein
MDPTEPGGRPPLPGRPAPPPAVPWTDPGDGAPADDQQATGGDPPDWTTGGQGTAAGPPAWATRGPTAPPTGEGRPGAGTAEGWPGRATQVGPPGPPAGGGWPAWEPPAGPPARRRRVGWVVALVAVLVAALVAGVLALRPGVRVEPSQQAAGRRPSATAPPDPRVEVPKLLARRARAVLRGDRAAFLATVDRRRTRYYRDQATLFARMRTVPFSAVAYRLADRSDLATATVRRRYAPDRVYLPHVQARYRFKGHDASPVLGRLYYTFVLTPSGWRVGGQGDAQPAWRDDVEIWDSGPVRTLRSARTLVVHHPGSERLAGRLLRAAERAYGEVAATWPDRWERKVVILAPRDEREAERLVHARDLSKVAALASSSVESGPVERVLGNRIVANSTVLGAYDPLNFQTVVTHEMTHVATRTLGNGIPLFLVEGFADYTALRPLRFPLRLTRPTLAERVGAGRFDGRLPSARELRGPDGVLAYEESSSFCLWAAETFGEGRLRALYRAFAGSTPATAAELELGFRRTLGISRRTAEARWAAWVRGRL